MRSASTNSATRSSFRMSPDNDAELKPKKARVRTCAHCKATIESQIPLFAGLCAECRTAIYSALTHVEIPF